jgi:hypothetical protein
MKLTGATGGCLCGAVRFTYDGDLGGDLGAVTLCVCGQCRKAQGFGSAVGPAQADGFSIVAGSQHVREYESSPGKYRAFCVSCGSPLYSRLESKPASLRIRLGAFDALPEALAVDAVIHTGHAPAWTNVDESARHPGVEPGRP